MIEHKIDWSKITDNVAVNCRTEEEAEMFVGAAFCEKDLKNKDYWEKLGTRWCGHKGETCYIFDDKSMQYGGKNWYEGGGYTILPFSDILIQEPERDQTAKADTTRKVVIDKALKTVTSDREQQYGSPEDNFKEIGKLWSQYLDKQITAKDVSVLMCLFKIARIKTGRFKEDNWIDLIGYAACGAEVEGKE